MKEKIIKFPSLNVAKNNYSFKRKGLPKKTERNLEVNKEKAFQQVINDMYNGEKFNILYIELSIIKNLILNGFTQLEISQLMGICIRTIRNRINQYGLKNLRENNCFLQK